MNFFNPNVIFEGIVQLENAPSQSNHAVRKDWVESNAIMAIHTDSSLLAETVVVNGSKQLKLKSLAVTDVSVDSTATSLANWISSNYSNGDEVQEGDMIILTNTSSARTETYIHNGGTAGTSADFTEIEGSDVSATEVRSLLSASSGINYNSSTGAFTANQGQIRGFFSAGTGLSYDDANGVYSLNVDSDGINEGSSNLYFTDARAQAAISVSGAGLAKSGGAISLTADTDDISEGSTNQYFTDARARAALALDSTVQNQLLNYNSSTGVLSVDMDDLRKEFANQSLTANTFATLNHNLGKKFVHVSAYDANDNLVMLDVQLTDSNNLKVKAGSNKTGLKIVVSI